jgi:hypothetical protein
MRIATYNVNGINGRLGNLLEPIVRGMGRLPGRRMRLPSSR